MRNTRWYRWLLVVAGLVLLSAEFSPAQSIQGTFHGRKAAEGEVLVKFRRVSAPEMAAIAQASDVSSFRPLGGVRHLYRLRSRSKKIDELIAQLSARPDVLYAEPNYEWQALELPNDPQFLSQWALQNTGQYSDGFSAGTPGADIRAVTAWDVSTGGTAHLVGIVDTGLDYTHPDLQPNIWSAPMDFTVTLGGVPVTCPAGSHGFNAITGLCDPMDDHMHGTHVSGIIGASGNNSLGVVGVNWTARIIGLKFLNSQGYGYTSDAINAIEFGIQAKAAFAATNGADLRILSNSWGGSGFSQALLDEIDLAAANDILFVAAAGNSAANLDLSPMYPASFNRPNMIAVAATDNTDALAPFSNYGPNSVHLGAPGVAILSTLPNQAYGYLSGTSMATPYVSGAALLMLSACGVDTTDLKKNLLDNVDITASLSGLTISGGRLNLNRAIRSCSGPVGLSPASLSFGAIALGKSSPTRIVTLTNYQNSTLNISGIVATDDFAQTNDCGASLSPKAACSITMTFTPSSPGAQSGQLRVLDDAANSPQVAELSGIGLTDVDLVAGTSTTTKATSPGSVIPVSSTVTNQGTADAGASVAGIYLSRSGVKDKAAALVATFNAPSLSAGNSFSAQTNITVPNNVSLGAYYLLTCADDTNLINETNETNNCGATASTIQVQLADLSESSVSFVRTDPQTIQVTETVINQGVADAPASLTQFYATVYAWKDSSAHLLTGGRTVPQLAVGATSQGTTTVTIPQDLVGNFYVFACADDTNRVTESSESNNCAAALTKLQLGPDLIEYAVSSMQTVTGAGAAITVSDTAINQGLGNAGSSFSQYYLSPFTSKTNTARPMIGSRAVNPLSAGSVSAGSATATVPSDMPTGNYYLLACADDTNLVPETSESNNCAAWSTRVQVGPDLIESAASGSTIVTGPGAIFTVSDTTINPGGGSAGNSFTQYYLSPFTSKTSNARLLSGNRAVTSLPSGASFAGSAMVTVPPNMPIGTYYLLACADDTKLVVETNETNNCAAWSIRMQVGPDLIVFGPSSSTVIATLGATFTVSDTVINQGGSSAGASFTQYYLGPFTTKTSNARLLTGNRAITALAAGTNLAGSTSVTVPSDMPIGSYYLLACADDTNLVPETNDNNNCASGTRRVQITP